MLEASVSDVTTSYTATNLTNGIPYVFFLKFVDITGSETTFSPSGIVIPRAPASFLRVSPSRISNALLFGNVSYKIQVESNANWVVNSPVPDWITVAQVTATSFRINVEPNLTGFRRQADISVVTINGDNSATVSLTQEGPPVLNLTATDGVAHLSWSVFPEGVQGVNVYHQDTVPVLLQFVDITRKSFDHTGLTPGSPHSYYVTAVSFDGTESAPSNSEGIFIPEAGVKGFDDTSLAVYPNPVENNQLTLRGKLAPGSYNAVIVNMYGKLLLRQRVSVEENETSTGIDVSSLSPGLYLMTLTDSSGKPTAPARVQIK